MRQNGVPEPDLGRLDVLVHVRSLGENWRSPTRRVNVGADTATVLTDWLGLPATEIHVLRASGVIGG